jgi:hypothetical protein
MTSRYLIIPAALLALAAVVCSNPSASAAPDGPAGDADVAVQARGPVHEAYAQPFNAVPQAGPVVPKAPPDPIPELPPDQKPEGDNVQWIPGYWGWDADRKDYLWVSGFWRAAPPDHKWVAGYWRKADDGWQWVAGYWGPTNQERPPLLDPPPQPPDAGPTVPAPDDNSLYVPGSWVPRADRYLWRPGYWRPARLGWVWVPAHFVWTPAGCVFVDGYWDYPLETRGVLFAPVAFSRPLWETPGWCFRPRFTVGIGADFFASLFVRPSCGSYYFGDYYDPVYLKAGFEPWCRYGSRHHDPLFGYYRWSHHDDPAWMRNVGAVYAGRRAGDLARPPHTLAEQVSAGRRGAPAVVHPLSEFRGGRKLTTIDRAQVTRHQEAARKVQDAGRRRDQVERPVTHGRPPAVSSPSHAAPVIVNQHEDRAAQHHREVHQPAPAVEHHAAKPAAPPVIHKQAAPLPPAPPHVPERHIAPTPKAPTPKAPVHIAPAPKAPAPKAPAHVAAAPKAPAHVAPAPKAPPPARHVSPPPPHAAAHHANPPAHHAPPAPAHSGGKGGHQAGGHKKK